jgi:hypothetical protein
LVSVSVASQRTAAGLPYAPPHYMELVLLTAVKGGSYLEFGGVRYGPVTGAVCRGNGDFVQNGKSRSYRHFVCAVRVRNADRLALIQATADGSFVFKEWL